MNRPYTAHSPYSLAPTERIESYQESYEQLEGLQEYPGYESDYDDYDNSGPAGLTDEDEARIDRRWMWVAGIAGVILFIAVGTTGVILGGGDSGSVSATATSEAPATSSAPATTSAPAAGAPAPVVPSLPPETVTTVTPTAETTAAAPVQTPAQTPEAAPPPAPAPRTVTYRVTGNRQLIDMVTVIYTDAQGALQTDVNVALPWTKTIVLDPGVELSSVTATSVAGQLNCSITDADGAVIAQQNTNTMITTCTR